MCIYLYSHTNQRAAPSENGGPVASRRGDAIERRASVLVGVPCSGAAVAGTPGGAHSQGRGGAHGRPELYSRRRC